MTDLTYALVFVLVDEEEAETRRSRYVSDMNDLEKQFADLKEQFV